MLFLCLFIIPPFSTIKSDGAPSPNGEHFSGNAVHPLNYDISVHSYETVNWLSTVPGELWMSKFFLEVAMRAMQPRGVRHQPAATSSDHARADGPVCRPIHGGWQSDCHPAGAAYSSYRWPAFDDDLRLQGLPSCIHVEPDGLPPPSQPSFITERRHRPADRASAAHTQDGACRHGRPRTVRQGCWIFEKAKKIKSLSEKKMFVLNRFLTSKPLLLFLMEKVHRTHVFYGFLQWA